jgi:AraC-like DNA-binding protein
MADPTHSAHREKDEQAHLSAALLSRLRPLSGTKASVDPGAGKRRLPGRVFTYCCHAVERLGRIRGEHPMLGIVLSGEKELWLGDRGERFSPGQVFAFPSGLAFDVVNTPDPRSGLYESLLVEILRVPEAAARAVVRPRPRPRAADLRVPLSEDLVQALAHAATALGAGAQARDLGEHRLAEVLLLLQDEPAASCLFDVSLAERVEWLVASEPSRAWTAAALGRELGLGASTLRRRLDAAGTPLRAVMAAARMRVAHAILVRGRGSVTEAAEAAGYVSRSHFVSRFRSTFGVLPREVRAPRP